MVAGPPTASYTPAATTVTQTAHQQKPTANAEPARPRGLLEPGAATSGTPGSERGGPSQGGPPTRPVGSPPQSGLRRALSTTRTSYRDQPRPGSTPMLGRAVTGRGPAGNHGPAAQPA